MPKNNKNDTKAVVFANTAKRAKSAGSAKRSKRAEPAGTKNLAGTKKTVAASTVMRSSHSARARSQIQTQTRTTGRYAQSAREKILVKEIEKLLPLLDEECLEALLHSAYNLASSLEEERERAEQYEAFERAVYETFKPKETKKATSGQKTKSTSRGTSKSAAKASASVLAIERSEDGRFFNIILDGKWKLFNSEEMAALARIALVNEPLTEACPRVFAWLKRERSDMLSDFAISSATSSRIQELVRLMRKTFKPNKK